MTQPARVLIAEARFYEDLADDLAAGAGAVLTAAQVSFERIAVPGCFELPATIRMAIGERPEASPWQGVIALGCVIRGETTHYDTVCNDSSRGLTLLGLQGICIGNGILTVENRPQAVVRADPGGQDKGGGAAAAALHLIALSRRWAGSQTGIGFRA